MRGQTPGRVIPPRSSSYLPRNAIQSARICLTSQVYGSETLRRVRPTKRRESHRPRINFRTKNQARETRVQCDSSNKSIWFYPNSSRPITFPLFQRSRGVRERIPLCAFPPYPLRHRRPRSCFCPLALTEDRHAAQKYYIGYRYTPRDQIRAL